MSDRIERFGPGETRAWQYRAAARPVAQQATSAVDAEGRIRLWDTGAERVVGFKAAAMLGRRCCDTICKIAVAQAGTCTTHERLTHKAMRGGLPPTVTLDVATAEGRLVTLTADPSAVWLGAGTGRLAVLHKVTGVLGAVAPEARKPAGTAWGETQTRLVYVGSYGAVDMEM